MTALRWYVCRTDIRREDRAELGLQALGLTVYLPREMLWRGRGQRREVVRRPLLPRHLFVGVRDGENRFEEIRRCDGIECLIRFGAEAAPCVVRWSEIARVQAAEGELEDRFHNAQAREAEKARHGNDTDEFIEKLKAAAPDERVTLLMSLLGRGKKAKLTLADLKELAS